MDAATKQLWWKAGTVILIAFAAAAAFSAYLRPDMIAAFADVWAFCTALIR